MKHLNKIQFKTIQTHHKFAKDCRKAMNYVEVGLSEGSIKMS